MTTIKITDFRDLGNRKYDVYYDYKVNKLNPLVYFILIGISICECIKVTIEIFKEYMRKTSYNTEIKIDK